MCFDCVWQVRRIGERFKFGKLQPNLFKICLIPQACSATLHPSHLVKAIRALLFLSLGWCIFSPSLRAAPTTNGLYAAFNTSMGTFYCQLRYDLTPRTVANFITLADGSKSWLDYSRTRLVQQPFYNGLTFHRVVAGFVIQAGSPNGLGTDDPGYYFNNEIASGLNNDSAGVLAMANGGSTNSNGSQFYITLAPQPALDGHYTVFGSVVEGLNVVTNIGNVPTDTSNKPLVPIVISNVMILRIGTAASNFNALAVSPPLPVPHFKASQMLHPAPDLLLVWNYSSNSVYRVCYSSDLKAWNGFYLGAYGGRYMDDFAAAFPIQYFTTVETPIDP
jgi:cyclophilin family peptidyl-prolyl cis-trans isomerase